MFDRSDFSSSAGAEIGRYATVLPHRPNLYRRWGKRLFDIVFVVLMAPIMLPVILLLAAIVAAKGGSPLFGHRRVGQNGVEFRCLKLRSMVPDAQQVLQRLIESDPEARREWEGHRKLTDDPRITRLGSFLRKSSLDELPQLWNILRGEMSVVGPRPVPADELTLYGPARRHYLAVKPGLTGLWQVSGRNDVSYAERVALDVDYERRISFWRDIGIILMTARAVFARTGK